MIRSIPPLISIIEEDSTQIIREKATETLRSILGDSAGNVTIGTGYLIDLLREVYRYGVRDGR